MRDREPVGDAPGKAGRGKLTRRDFFRGASALGGAALGVGGSGATAQGRRMPLRELGRTKLMVSAISFGTHGVENPGVLEAALDAGVNLVDTGPSYRRGEAEKSLGNVMKTRRDDAYIITKWAMKADTTKDELLASLDASLQRLQTDHVDIIQAFMVDDPKLLDKRTLHAAFAEAQKAGKVRFQGFSSHGRTIPDVVERGAASGKFDVCMPKYNFMESSPLEPVMADAASNGMGFAVMKVYAVARQPEIRDPAEAQALKNAAVKWALSNPSVASVCMSMPHFEDVQAMTALAGQQLEDHERSLLEEYAQALSPRYCRSCGTCSEACPERVAIADIMRYRMYFKYYGLEKDSMQLYADLPADQQARACAGCRGHCVGRCPYGLNTHERLLEAHALLT
jgi:predicted aldo/keto reductase-like oxidoreductase